MTIERRQACLAVLGAVVLFALAPAMSSGARVPDQPLASLPAGERWLREVEVRGLGPAHAAEHARLRAAGRPHPTAQRTTPVTAAATEPVDVGRWLPKFSIPGVAVHAVMLHTGKVLYFTGTTQGRAYLLDPVTRTTRAVHPPRIAEREDEPANIFCAGQSFLDDGTVLVMGGTIGRREGLDTIFTFDPVTETWRRRANMRHGRWYPTQVLLADGRTVVLDGLDERGEPNVNPEIESYTPNFNFVTLLSVRGQTGQPPPGGLYPHTFQMPSGRVLVAGPEPSDSWFFRLSKIGSLSWEDAPNPTRHTWGTGVLLPGAPTGSTRVALIGGVDRASLPDTGTSTPLPGVQTFDEANPSAGWSSAPPLNHGRAHHNTVQLPDGTMVTVGGGYGILNGNRRSGDAAVHRNIELYDPSTQQWTLGPAQDELRTYHSTALLLPDARVLSAGDDGYGGSTNDTAEIYEPPYLFRGPRPTINSVPDSIEYGKPFTIGASDDATEAVLIAPGAVTHANDMSQRHVRLARAAGRAGTLTVKAPPSPAVAPPTYYMLFVLNEAGVPSVAKFVRLKVGPPDVPPDTVISSGPPAQTQSTSATFQFHSTEPDSTFRCAREGGQPVPCTSPWSYSELSEGPHSFEVTAIDPTGNVDPSPATWSWTIDTPPDTVIDSGPPAQTQSTSAAFEFHATQPGSTFRCARDGGQPVPCTSPWSYSGLSQGPHSFGVTAIDPAGNADPTPATRSWAVQAAPGDVIPPETSIVSGPSVSTTSASATFEFSSTEAGSSFACRLDGGDWIACSSPITYAELPPGPHTFAVRATDQAGNTDPSAAAWVWTVETSTPPPITDLTKPPTPAGGGTSAPDSMPPAIDLLAKPTRRTLKQRRIVVGVACPTEACTATAGGRILVPGTARALDLRPASARIERGNRATLALGFSKKVSKLVRRALSRRKRVRVSLVLTARDATGNAATTRRSFILKA